MANVRQAHVPLSLSATGPVARVRRAILSRSGQDPPTGPDRTVTTAKLKGCLAAAAVDSSDFLKSARVASTFELRLNPDLNQAIDIALSQ